MKKKLPINVNICIAICIIVIVISFFVFQITYKRMIFQKYVYNPVPKSVKNLKVDKRAGDRKYIMKFNINKEDSKLFINTKPFEEISSNNRYWDADPNILQYLDAGAYSSNPVWFRPYALNNPKVYMFKEIIGANKNIEHIQLLIYHENASEIYFLEYQKRI